MIHLAPKVMFNELPSVVFVFESLPVYRKNLLQKTALKNTHRAGTCTASKASFFVAKYTFSEFDIQAVFIAMQGTLTVFIFKVIFWPILMIRKYSLSYQKMFICLYSEKES